MINDANVVNTPLTTGKLKAPGNLEVSCSVTGGNDFDGAVEGSKLDIICKHPEPLDNTSFSSPIIYGYSVSCLFSHAKIRPEESKPLQAQL
jgi:hypothetical protein